MEPDFPAFCLFSTDPATLNASTTTAIQGPAPNASSSKKPSLVSSETITLSSTDTSDLPQQHSVSQDPRSGPVPTAGPSSEPAHDSDTLSCQLGTKGKWLVVCGNGQRQKSVSGIRVQRFLPSGGRVPIGQSCPNSQRTESWKASVGS